MNDNNSDIKKLNTVKDSLEDMALYLPELEKLTLELISADLSDDYKESNYLQYKLKILEYFVENLNKKISEELGINPKEQKKLS
ncbi:MULTISPECIES: hypothetical protein [Calditerrivibrio]|uniref:Uncharacterized protein n=2 Tax=Calditerrivibrio nitroreducens TaxID=477976 RepID=E4TJF3_CALNY|nr:hypothetical protein [Calditerrivibrio nitroreducens]ADR19220.1 hypothetical protein Calni_1312 [Calditerrivibrio nitroreducens DSM 19672]PMP72372.1 MAG: hypothetical protein C0187_01715 [Calditerrivibrio nitroreducens]